MPLALAADRKPGIPFLDLHLFERLEILFDIRPLKMVVGNQSAAAPALFATPVPGNCKKHDRQY